MAATTADAQGTGKLGMVVTLAILTAFGGGAGALVGRLVAARLHAVPADMATATPARLPYSGDTDVRELEPIVTDLAGEPPIRVRLQVSIVYASKLVDKPAILAAQVGDDILAFLKTLTLAQMQGASGLQNLREDLNERAATRSQGAVREVIIETLVTQ